MEKSNYNKLNFSNFFQLQFQVLIIPFLINLSQTTFEGSQMQMNKNKKKSRFLLNKSLSMNEQLSAFNSALSQPINQQEQYEQQDSEKKQVKRQIGIFQEFKIKYDELRKQNQQKRNQIDDLKKLNKRLQIQLLNINTQFYDKQIKRLRSQVDKWQEDCENFKFKYFEVQNKRKQLQSSLNVNEKQMSKIIKQLQTQKVQNVQLKYQIKQNQKQYLSIIATVQESSNKSAQRYSQCEGKLSATENQLKRLKRELENEKNNMQKFQKSKKQTNEQNKKSIQKYQIQIKNIKKQLDQSQDQCRQYRKQVFTLKQKISQLTLEMVKNKSLFDFEVNKNYQKINQFRSSRLLEIENKRFKEQNQTLKRELQHKTVSLNTLQKKFNENSQDMQINLKQNEQKLQDLQNKKSAIQKHYQTKIISLNKQIQILKIKCLRSQSQQQKDLNKFNTNKLGQIINNQPLFKIQSSQSQKDKNPFISFQNQIQQVLLNKDIQIKQLKKALNEKIQQIFKLKQQIEEIQITSQNMKNQIFILQKKLSVQQKNITSRNQIQLLEMKNQIQSLTRKLTQNQTKLQIKNKQIKEKNTFIVDSIIGRIQKQEDAHLVLTEIQRIFEGGYIQKLADAQTKIKILESREILK